MKNNTKIQDENLKILVINYEFPPLGGGGGVASYDFALEWKKYGKIDVLTSNFKGLNSFENINGINIFRTKIFFRKSRDTATFLSMLSFLITGFLMGVKLCKKNRYNIINTHFAIPTGPLGYILSKIFKIPNVLSLHGGDIYDPSKKMSPHKNPIFGRIVKFILNRADRIVAQSNSTRDNAIKYYSPNKDIAIIPLGFHPPIISKKNRNHIGLDKDSFYFVTIARLIKRKSIDTILHAMSKINNKKIKFIVMGDGPEMDFLVKLTNELGLQDRVIFLGHTIDDDKYVHLKNSDSFILIPMNEPFGIVFMEAMFAGLPIICSNSGGQTDFLFDGKNALLVEFGDIESCKNSMLKIYKDGDLRKMMSKNNKEKIKDFYAESVAYEYIRIFRELKKSDI